mgnify:CR=1 FL=1
MGTPSLRYIMEDDNVFFPAFHLALPVLMILGTVGFMLGTGGTALVAATYGAGDRARANRYFSLLPALWGIDGVWIAVVAAEVMSVVVSIVFLLAKKGKYHY